MPVWVPRKRTVSISAGAAIDDWQPINDGNVANHGKSAAHAQLVLSSYYGDGIRIRQNKEDQPMGMSVGQYRAYIPKSDST